MRIQFLGILVSRGLGSALQAVALVVLARSVTASDFGVVTAIVALVGFVLVATGFGMATFVPRARAQRADDDVLAGLRLNARSTAATIPVLLVVTGWWAWHHGAPVAAALICVSLGLERNVDTMLGVPIADGNSRIPAVSMVLRRSVSLGVLVVGLLVHVEPVLAYTVGLLAGSLAAQVHVRSVVRDLPGEARAVGDREVARRSWAFLVAHVAQQARLLDITVVAALLAPAAAGVYAAASKLVQPLLLVPQSLAAVVAPRAARESPPRARRLGLRMTTALLALGVLVVPIGFVAEPLTTLVYGDDYRGAGAVLTWSLASVPFFAVSAVLAALLQGQGHERIVAVVGVGSAVATVAGVAAGAVVGGVVGAAAGLAVASAARAIALVVPTIGLGAARS